MNKFIEKNSNYFFVLAIMTAFANIVINSVFLAGLFLIFFSLSVYYWKEEKDEEKNTIYSVDQISIDSRLERIRQERHPNKTDDEIITAEKELFETGFIKAIQEKDGHANDLLEWHYNIDIIRIDEDRIKLTVEAKSGVAKKQLGHFYKELKKDGKLKINEYK